VQTHHGKGILIGLAILIGEAEVAKRDYNFFSVKDQLMEEEEKGR
jgi:hypothetical protein